MSAALRALSGLGTVLMVISATAVMASEQQISEAHTAGVYALAAVVFFSRAAGWHMRGFFLQHLYPLYRFCLYMIGGAFLLIACWDIAGSLTGGLLILFCLIWLGEPTRRHESLGILFGGWLLIRSYSRVWNPIDERFILLFCMFSLGAVIVLYSLQKRERFAVHSRRKSVSLSELIETGMVLCLCILVPACVSIAVTVPLTAFFLDLKKEFITFESRVSGSPLPDSGLFVYIGIVIILAVLLIVIWRKIADRATEDQAELKEEMMDLFGKSRSLNLERRKTRRFGNTYRWKVIELYFRFTQLMARRSAGKTSCQTPEEYSSVLHARGIGDADAVQALTRFYISARFSPHSVEKRDYRQCRDMYTILRKSVDTP